MKHLRDFSADSDTGEDTEDPTICRECEKPELSHSDIDDGYPICFHCSWLLKI